MRELRSRLALAPDQMPEPPLYQAKAPIFAVVVRLTGVMVLAAGGALGFLWITAPHTTPPDSQTAGRSGSEAALVSYRGLDAPQPSPAPDDVKFEQPQEPTSNPAPWSVANQTRDLTDGVGSPPAAPAPRAAVPTPAAPRTTAPRVSVTPPPAAAALPAAPAPSPVAPVSVAAPVPIAAPVPVAPVPVAPAPTFAAPPPAPAYPSSTATAAPDRDEVAALLTRARAYLSAGDIAAARLVLRRAADRDDPQAALALGGTYDPTVLKRLGIINFHADPVQARDWYRKAAELGSPDASLRLEQLVQTSR